MLETSIKNKTTLCITFGPSHLSISQSDLIVSRIEDDLAFFKMAGPGLQNAEYKILISEIKMIVPQELVNQINFWKQQKKLVDIFFSNFNTFPAKSLYISDATIVDFSTRNQVVKVSGQVKKRQSDDSFSSDVKLYVLPIHYVVSIAPHNDPENTKNGIINTFSKIQLPFYSRAIALQSPAAK